MTAQSVSIGNILDELRMLAGKHAGMLAGCMLGIGGAYTAIDWLSLQLDDDGAGGMMEILVGLIIGIYVQYAVTERLLADRLSLRGAPPVRRYGVLFVASLLIGIGLLLGLVMLVLPALYLSARWMIATPMIVEDNVAGGSGFEALKQSWQTSAPFVPAFLLATLLYGVIIVASEAVPLVTDFADLSAIEEQLVWAISNLLTGLSNVFGWTLAASAYRRAVPVQSGLEQVFA